MTVYHPAMGYIIVAAALIILSSALFVVARSKDFRDTSHGRVMYAISAVSVLALLITTFAESAVEVDTGHVGLVYTFGAITGQRGEGFQWILPWQNLEQASVQIQGHKFDKMGSFSSETQSITVTATVNARVLPSGIQSLYRDVGKDYFTVLLQPRVLQAFKDETVKYSSIDIAPKREAIRAAVRDTLKTEMEGRSIFVEDLLIDDISFEKKFEDAIEEKQTQSQLALAEKEKVGAEHAKADQKLEQARGDAGAVLILAEKQAEANKKLAESLTPEYVQYLAVTKLSPNVSVMMVPSNQGMILGPEFLKKPEAEKK